ncbi:sialate O-acetylesterase isoform X2 [Misgurnus anguillicaudatus]|uniref:sialate O-acetylesterase isoform X2 n=1 Tax=Misgurnus anguillicaudatus TaxID=75329 RepID=UPI002434CE9C|nr:sialate O-acetylesterase isoform X2 [Misgurnus anguillicaudatus]
MLTAVSLSLILGSLTAVLSAAEELRFASYYGNHMVLQKAPAKAVVWGYGHTGAKIVLSLSGSHNDYKTATRVVSGIWHTTLSPVEAGGPYTLIVLQTTTNTSIMLTDVLFGDIWLCGGQSNMAFTVGQINNATEELAMVSKFSDVRIFQAALEQSNVELYDLPGVEVPWSRPTAELLGGKPFTHFSAVCWLFGRYLYQTLNYPIGLVDSCWGGTPVEAWSASRPLHKCGLNSTMTRQLPVQSNFWKDMPFAASWKNSVLWNAMIHPLLNMTIKGAIWYQGEANAGYNRDEYNCSFPAMIDDWRRAFHQGSGGQTAIDFPFGFVQLSTWEKNYLQDGFREIRWHQTADYGFAPNKRMHNTFMAVAVDLPDEKSPWGSIHPRFKRDVAYRLVLGARAVAYGEKGVSFQGPFPAEIQFDQSSINIMFDQEISAAYSDNAFEICCSANNTCTDDSQWISVPMKKLGSNYILLSLSQCPSKPTALRYLWRDWPCAFNACPIYSSDKVLPTPPFLERLD